MTRTVNLFECAECKGSGSVTILNAYDPDYRGKARCPACDGEGLVSQGSFNFSPVITPTLEDTAKLN